MVKSNMWSQIGEILDKEDSFSMARFYNDATPYVGDVVPCSECGEISSICLEESVCLTENSVDKGVRTFYFKCKECGAEATERQGKL
jgi:hypothetical protein